MTAGTRLPGPSAQSARRGTHGFTLLEVLVALVIVALGMSALLAALSASASNTAALREKTLAEWIAMNQIANMRLGLTVPAIGTTEGDVRNCGNGNWHWQQQIAAVNEIPGLLSVTVSVQRTGDASSSASAGGSGSSSTSASGTTSLGAANPLGATGTINATGCINSTGPGSSLGATNSLGMPNNLGGPASSAAGSNSASSSSAGSQNAASDKNENWLVTLTGFRGSSLGAASGESPDWVGSTFAGNGGTNGIPNGTNGGGVQGPLAPPNGSAPTTPQNRGVLGL